MGAMFTMLFAKIAAFATWLGLVVVAFFAAFWLLAKDVVSWGFDQVLTVAVSAVSSISATPLTSLADTVGPLPASLINVLSLLGVGTAISIILAAISIRLVLQLIPFTRLGS